MKKTVRFDLVPQVHWLFTYVFAYKQSRIGHWEQDGRDRARFQNRILQMEKPISDILNKNHRDKILKERENYIHYNTK